MKLNILAKTGLIFLMAIWSCKDDEADANTPVINNFIPDRGVPGTAVAIFGRILGSESNTAISFNGTPATISRHSGADIEVIVPAGAESGPLTITVGGKTTVSEKEFTVVVPVAEDPEFFFGADLSYVNQILDRGGVYREGGMAKDPYAIFDDHGTDVVRLRLWHNPLWTKEVYEPDGNRLYNELLDVEKSIQRSKELGMKVLLDFHYSDIWADPGSQEIPAAWLDVKELSVLRDSVYNYTAKTLQYLDRKGLMPEFVQIGNEINCGMLYEHDGNPVPGFPACNVCDGQWSNLAAVLNSGIKAVRDVSAESSVKSRILLHVADPANITWWFDNVAAGGVVSDFDIIGISYYPIWHTGVSVDQLSDQISDFRDAYGKDVMILETAYPWTSQGNDNYNNIFGSQTPVTGYSFSQEGQLDMMHKITQEVIDGGGIGLVYWEPAWITSPLRDYWNTGSAWENCAFFDFDGNVLPAIDYMTQSYQQQ
ncbi:MAG: glycosyl hydrolase 53 family protein [Bacteroidota bacterium]|nr:glycosyl hydrolase 53 family protein [Bacteroidota bacterium]